MDLLNLTHRDSHEFPTPLEPGKRYKVKVRLDDIAMRIPKGHRLRVSISTSYWPLMWPAPEPVTLTVYAGESRFIVPVRKRNPERSAAGMEECGEWPSRSGSARIKELRGTSARLQSRMASPTPGDR